MTLLAPAIARPAAATAAETAPRPLGALRDDRGLLGGGPNAASLHDRVAGAAARAGMPIVVVIVGGAPSARGAGMANLEEAARLRFAEEKLSEEASDAVLLLVAPRAGRAVLETGKGEAGIVPQIDGRRITADLARALDRHASTTKLARALAEAVDRIADSALATRDRRRPLAEPRVGERDEIPAPLSSGHQRPSAGTSHDQSATAQPRRSRMPVAYGLAIVLMLGVALRQRRRFGSGSAHRHQATPRPKRPKLPGQIGGSC